MAHNRVKRVFFGFVLVGFVVVVAGVAALFYFNREAELSGTVRIVEVPFSAKGADATTIGRIIFIDSDRIDDSELLAHELVHVCQWEELGIEFLWQYTSEFVTNYAELGDRREAYKQISFEQDARTLNVECDLDAYTSPP